MSLFKQALIPTILGIILSPAIHAELVTIDFDKLSGMANAPNASVPATSKLSNDLLSFGVNFASSADFVAVVNHSPLPTVSMPNIIGGVNANGTLNYDSPVIIKFFDPSNPKVKAVTDFVTIRGDKSPFSGVSSAKLEAFDALGNSLGGDWANDSVDGLKLSFLAPGIHSIRLTQSSGSGGTIGFDDLSFNSLKAYEATAATCPAESTFSNGVLTLNSVEVPDGAGGTNRFKASLKQQPSSDSLVFSLTNAALITASASSLGSPDLVVTKFNVTGNITRTLDGGNTVPVQVIVRNQGNAAASLFKVGVDYTGANGTFPVQFTVAGHPSNYYPSAKLAAGAEVTLNGRLNFSASAGHGVAVSVSALADSCSGDEFMPDYCRVNESDERNNSLSGGLISLF